VGRGQKDLLVCISSQTLARREAIMSIQLGGSQARYHVVVAGGAARETNARGGGFSRFREGKVNVVVRILRRELALASVKAGLANDLARAKVVTLQASAGSAALDIGRNDVKEAAVPSEQLLMIRGTEVGKWRDGQLAIG
jgi:hypothetical protein